VILIGGGGHARVLLDSLRLRSVEVLGIVDRDPEAVTKRVLGVPVLGPEKVILDHDPSEVLLVNGLGGVGDTSSRTRVFQSFTARGYTFAGVVHPRAIISSTVLLSEGIQVMAGVVINPGTTVGDNAIINTSASVDHDCRIGAHAHIAPGVTLSGTVTVGEGAHIGTGATVIQGVTIGSRAIVGAGTVVLRDVPAERTVVGNPARVLGVRDPEDTP
jgi:sugar O-acyltransferase (sialic acid O-acetyltransferase NeuD family)